jgi:hypothetical protein
MSTRILVPEPCTADWNQMTPTDKGRHCAQCAKTVVDFSSWPLENIAAYLRKHSSERVCGRFRNTQLDVEVPYSPDQWVAQVAGTGLSLLQKMALIFLLAFGFLTTGCGSDTESSPAKTAQTSLQSPALTGVVALAAPATDSPTHCSQQPDTTAPMILGKIVAPPPADTAAHRMGRIAPPKGLQPLRLPGTTDPRMIQGEPAMIDPGPTMTAGAPMMVEEPQQLQGDVRLEEPKPDPQR